MRLKRFICALTLLCLLATCFPMAEDRAQAAAKYYIQVDLTNQIVTVYDNGNTTEAGIVRQMICSTGKSGHATPTGTYTLPSKWKKAERTEWYYFPEYSCYAKWATRIVGGILFHSVLYTGAKKGPTKSSVNALGSRASHGCVRLRVADAKWIAQNCPAGTTCKIYSSGKKNTALRKKLLKKCFSRASETYDHFMGRDGDAEESVKLSRGSKGSKVTELQTRLKALGFLTDVVDGKFGANTETAVKRFQKADGLKASGKVDDALWKKLFRDDAPMGTFVTLSQGMSGPAVAALQKALITLKLYDGAADGSFSKAFAQAVMRYQGGFGYAVTGSANQAVQKDVLARAESVLDEFGDAAYRVVTAVEEADMAKAKVALTLRAKASSKGKSVAKLKKGAEVLVLSKGKTWTKVEYNRLTGYLPNKHLTYFTGSRETVSYEAEPEATPEPTVEPTPEVFIPTPTPEIFIPTPTPEPSATPVPWDFVVAAPEAQETEDIEAIAEPDGTPVPELAGELAGEALEAGTEATPEPTPEPDVDGATGLALETEPAGDMISEE